MSRDPWPVEWSINSRKINGYLLNDQHVEGASKARFLRRFGFETNALDLMLAISDHPVTDAFTREIVSPRGDVKLIFEGPLRSPDGRNPIVRTVWRVDASLVAHFVTLVPLTGTSPSRGEGS